MATNAAQLAQGPEAPQPVNVAFDPQSYALLANLAEQQGTSVSQTLRDALSLQQYVVNVRRNGGKILVQQDGNISELTGLSG